MAEKDFEKLWKRAKTLANKLAYGPAQNVLQDILEKCVEISREQRSEVLAFNARISYWTGAYKNAKEDCNTALQLNNTNSTAHIVLGKIALNEFFFSKAQGHFASVDQPNAEAELALCRMHLRLRNITKARSHLTRAGQLISTTHPEYKIYAAYIELLNGKVDHAVSVGHSVVNEIKDTPELGLIVAELFVTAGNFSAAESLLKDLQKYIPANGEIFALLSQCSFLKLEFEKASMEAKRALQINPHNLFAMTVEIKIATRQGRYDEAIEIGQKILKLAPEYALAHANLGDAYFAKGDFNSTKIEYEAADVRNITNTKGAQLRRSRLAYIHGDYQKARELLEHLLDDTNIIYDDAIADLHIVYNVLGMKEEKKKLAAKMETRRAFSHRIDAALAGLTRAQKAI